MIKFPNVCKRELCGVTKMVDERIDESVLRWSGHWERIENDRIANGVYVRECVGSRSVGRLWKKWIDTVKECLKKRGMDVRETRRMVNYRSEWRGFLRGNMWGVARGINLRLRRDPKVQSCHSYMKPL